MRISDWMSDVCSSDLLVVDALAGIEAVFVVGRLYLARDLAGIVGRIEPRDPGGAAFRSEDVLPAGLDVRSQRGDESETGDDYAAHSKLLYSDENGPPALRRGAVYQTTTRSRRAGRRGPCGSGLVRLSSEERRVGKEGDSTFRSRCAPVQ